MSITVLQTDTVFYDSPDSGDDTCLCSRCLSVIAEEEVPLRVWPTDANDDGWDPDALDGTEYRYCRKCCEGMGITFCDDITASE